jgi:hypothetical protein
MSSKGSCQGKPSSLVMIRLPPEMVARIDRVAEKMRKQAVSLGFENPKASRAAVIRYLLAQHLPQLEGHKK